MRRDEVNKAIRFQGPSRVPIFFFNRDHNLSDLVAFEVQNHFSGPQKDLSEWGFSWRRLDETMGQPTTSLIQNWNDLNHINIPDPGDPKRFQEIEIFNQQYLDRYRIASLGLSGFTTMSFLRGFDNLMVDLVDNIDCVEALSDVVFGFEEKITAELPQHGFDAVGFFDDWGTQKGMFLSPVMWRKLFKPRYARQFSLAHSLGLSVYFHCCGQYEAIIEDLIEVGVDMLNLSQPNLYSIPDLGRKFGGKVCFVCPVSYQTTSISGTREQIFEDVNQLIRHLGNFNGGLIGYVEEYQSIGMPEENYKACVDAFTQLGRYEASNCEERE